jgi:hypothetical protein
MLSKFEPDIGCLLRNDEAASWARLACSKAALGSTVVWVCFRTIILKTHTQSAHTLKRSVLFKFQVAEMIRYLVDDYTGMIPAVLEIPSKVRPRVLRMMFWSTGKCAYVYHKQLHVRERICSDSGQKRGNFPLAFCLIAQTFSYCMSANPSARIENSTCSKSQNMFPNKAVHDDCFIH